MRWCDGHLKFLLHGYLPQMLPKRIMPKRQLYSVVGYSFGILRCVVNPSFFKKLYRNSFQFILLIATMLAYFCWIISWNSFNMTLDAFFEFSLFESLEKYILDTLTSKELFLA